MMNPRTSAHGTTLVLLVALGASGPQPTGNDESAVVADPLVSAGLPSIPDTRFTPFDAAKDDARFLRENTDAVAALVAAARSANAPLDRADRLLAAANLILAYRLSPACSRRFLRIEQDPAATARQAPAVDALMEADALLRQAGNALAPPDGAADAEEADLADRRATLDVLRAFTIALGAYLSVPAPADVETDARSAASELSPILEHPDPRIAAAARFWQTCLRAQEEDPSPALARLEPALLEPGRDARPYSFFARLLRCQLLAQEGHPATALSLLVQMEELCHQRWFPAESIQPAAGTIALVRLQVLADWYGRLSGEAHAHERTWCVERMQEIINERFAGDDRDILRISPVVPIIAVAPAEIPPATDDLPADALPPGTE